MVRNVRQALVVGASGGIGSALVEALAAEPDVQRIYAAARSPLSALPEKTTPLRLDLTDEDSIKAAARCCAGDGDVDLVIVATGILHDGNSVQPEKSWNALDADRLARVFAINTTGPALIAKHFLPLLPRKRRSVFASISARVGSVSDNRLGGWYAYRASKAALNMMLKTLAIELARRNPDALCIGLHPGTVDTSLSGPFQSNVPTGKLFTPERAARQLLAVIDAAEPAQSGRVLAWDGKEIQP